VRLVFTEEQEELRRSLRRYFEDRCPLREVRRVMEGRDGFDRELWQRMADELGLQGIAVPEAYGGAGFGAVELGIVFAEVGRALVPAPFLSSVALATEALLASGDEAACHRWLPGMVAGTLVGSVAAAGGDGRVDPESIATVASRDSGGRWRLDGTAPYVLDGAVADVVLVPAQHAEGLGLFAVEADAEGLRREPVLTMDQTLPQARLELAGVVADAVGDPIGAAGTLRRALEVAWMAMAAEAVGGAERCLELSVEHAKSRHQFGRPIGTYQAVKHPLADALVEVEQAKSLAYHAAEAIAEDPSERALAASMAKAYCTEVFFGVAATTIQVHGGIGFTWEHDAHLFFKRAKTLELLLGDPSWHRRQVAPLAGLR
jgi:alkylation response protein AidB-like acyl-CoA dehydrogenase